MRRAGGFGRSLGVDDELADPGLVAQVDEYEAAVVAAPRDPAGERDALPDMLGPDLAATEIAPAHCVNLSTSSPAGTDGSPELTKDDPVPQTVYRVAIKPANPIVVSVPLKFRK